MLKTVCSTDMLSDMQLFSRGWEFSSQSVPWKEVEVRMYALSMVSLYHLVKIANYCHKMQIHLNLMADIKFIAFYVFNPGILL